MKDRYNGTTLERASKRGHAVVVSLLLDNGANFNAEGRYEYGMMWEYSEVVVRLQLETGTTVNTEGRCKYCTTLQVASELGCKAVIKLLLKNNAAINADSEGEKSWYGASGGIGDGPQRSHQVTAQ